MTDADKLDYIWEILSKDDASFEEKAHAFDCVLGLYKDQWRKGFDFAAEHNYRQKPIN